MATAVLMSTRSNCERLHVGCVIVTGGARKNRLVAAGYNGYLPGTPHVSRLRGRSRAGDRACRAECRGRRRAAGQLGRRLRGLCDPFPVHQLRKDIWRLPASRK